MRGFATGAPPPPTPRSVSKTLGYAPIALKLWAQYTHTMTGTGASMATDIFQFWSGIRLKGGAHPADYEVLKRVQHNFDLRCLGH